MKRILAVVSVLLVLCCPLCLFVSAASSVTFKSRSKQAGGSTLTWSNGSTYSGGRWEIAWADSLISNANSLGFSVQGYEQWHISSDNNTSVVYEWQTTDEYILTYQYIVSLKGQTLISYGHSPNFPQGEVVGEYSTSYEAGTYTVTLDVRARTLATSSLQTLLTLISGPIALGDSFAMGVPIFCPVSASTEQEILNALDGIADQLDGLKDSIDGTNSRLDDLEDGLFNPPVDQVDEMNSQNAAVSDTRSRVDQALQDASVPEFHYSAPDISLDGEVIESGFSVVSRITWLLPIFATAVGCWITHIILFGIGK